MLLRIPAELLTVIILCDMGTRMKTTIEIADALLAAARQVAEREKTTLRALVEEGLRRIVNERQAPACGYKLPDTTFGGGGLLPGVTLEDWASIRDRIYEGRGGA
jgi:Arc/MetJ family transcription regulator